VTIHEYVLAAIEEVLQFWRRAHTSPAAVFEFPADVPSQTKAPEPFAFPAQAQPLKKCSPSGPVSFPGSFAKPEPQADKTKATLNTYRVRFDSKMVLARLDSLFGLCFWCNFTLWLCFRFAIRLTLAFI
jgi:hypothetical protein